MKACHCGVQIQGLLRLIISSVWRGEVCFTACHWPWRPASTANESEAGRPHHLGAAFFDCPLSQDLAPYFPSAFSLCCKAGYMPELSPPAHSFLLFFVSVRFCLNHVCFMLTQHSWTPESQHFTWPQSVAVRWHHHMWFFFFFHSLNDSLVSFHTAKIIY